MSTSTQDPLAELYLHHGSAADFMSALKREVSRHPALHAPLLSELAEGRLKDPLRALRNYAHQYSFYSERFPDYLRGVIGQLSSPAHREALEHNMMEELGVVGSTRLEERPHTELFALFKRAVGVTPDYKRYTPAIPTVRAWSAQFSQLCSAGPVEIGLGAIGLATEWIVPQQYAQLLRGIERCPTLGAEARVFFELHVVADDEHAETLLQITEEHAQTAEQRESIRFGALTALHLRAAFWEALGCHVTYAESALVR